MKHIVVVVKLFLKSLRKGGNVRLHTLLQILHFIGVSTKENDPLKDGRAPGDGNKLIFTLKEFFPT